MDLKSPGLVTKSFLKDSMDIIAPQIKTQKPKKIIFQFGTATDCVPHIGTYITQTLAFVLAKKAKETFGIDTAVIFKVLNHSSDLKAKTVDGIKYQINYSDSASKDYQSKKLEEFYFQYLDYVAGKLGVSYTADFHNKEQGSKAFRSKLISTMQDYEKIRWFLNPQTGNLPVRFPCSKCHYFDVDNINTSIVSLGKDSFTAKSFCPEHGWYESLVTAKNDTAVNVSTMYRNIIKECNYCDNDKKEFYVMIKGLDWQCGIYYLDMGLQAFGYEIYKVPLSRIFSPLITCSNGAKLAKSVLGGYDEEVNVKFRSQLLVTEDKKIIDKIIELCQVLADDVNSLNRCYSVSELERILLS